MAEATNDLSNNIPGNKTLTEKIRALHSVYSLTGKEKNALLRLPDDQIAYLASLMSGKSVPAPQLSQAQWDEMLRQLKDHWLLLLFYSQVKVLPAESQPSQETMVQLSRYYRIGQMQMLMTEYQLKEIINAFKAAGIPVLILKGTAIAYAYYPDPFTRLSNDIDLLVHPDSVRLARKTLESLGYVCNEKTFELSRKLYNEEEFMHSQKQRYKLVEVHWSLYISSDIDIDRLFDRAVSVSCGNVTFETLNPVDALLHNGLHLLMHHDDDVRLSWIYDAALMARNLPFPGGWAELQEKSVEYGAVRSVQVTLGMAELWTGLKLPPGFDDLSLWPQPGKQELAALANLNLNRSALMLDKIRFQWYCSSGLVEKLLLIKFFLFPPGEIMRNEFPGSPDWMLPVNFIRRWLKLIGKVIIYRGAAKVNSK